MSTTVSSSGGTMLTLALSVLVYARTSSPLLTGLAYVGGYVPQAIGALTLSSLADRLPSRTVLVASDGARAVTVSILATGWLPVEGMLVLLMASGFVSGALAGSRVALLSKILPPEAFVLGRSALNAANGATQVLGYAVGGALIATIGSVRTLWVAASLAFLACALDRVGLRDRPPSATGRGTVRVTWAGNRALFGNPYTRRLLLAQWIPNGLIVGAEALFVPYAGRHAGVLFAAAGAGMLAGDVLVGRWIPSERWPFAVMPLYLLLGVPYLAFAVRPSLTVAALLVAGASVGYGATLGVQRLFVTTIDDTIQGQAFAIAGAGMLTGQGLAAWFTGGLAEAMRPEAAITVTAALSIGATIALVTPLIVSARRLSRETREDEDCPEEGRVDECEPGRPGYATATAGSN